MNGSLLDFIAGAVAGFLFGAGLALSVWCG